MELVFYLYIMMYYVHSNYHVGRVTISDINITLIIALIYLYLLYWFKILIIFYFMFYTFIIYNNRCVSFPNSWDQFVIDSLGTCHFCQGIYWKTLLSKFKQTKEIHLSRFCWIWRVVRGYYFISRPPFWNSNALNYLNRFL